MTFLLFIYLYKIACVKAFVKTWNAACGGGGDISILLIPAGRTFLIQPIVFNGPCRSSNTKVQVCRLLICKLD